MCNNERVLTFIRKTLNQIKNFETFNKNQHGLYFEYVSQIKILEEFSKYHPSIRELLKKYSDLLAIQGLSKNIHTDRYIIARKGLESIKFQLENGCIRSISLVSLFLEEISIKPSVNIGIAEISLK